MAKMAGGVTLVVAQLLCATLALELKVGLYNEIPDLGGDKLESYKQMVEEGFTEATVNAVVNTSLYNVYDYDALKEYLTVGNFDLIEIDTSTLGQLVSDDLVVQISTTAGLPQVPSDTLAAALDAVTVNGDLYGYPTLVCGNFLIGLTPAGSNESCPLRHARHSYNDFQRIMTECKQSVLPAFTRMLGGKMNDEYGWYLPFLYLDGYIDIHGTEAIATAVSEVTSGTVDRIVCERLKWYIKQCKDKHPSTSNKCYHNFLGSYVNSSSNVYPDIVENETAFFFGFSEKVAPLTTESVVSNIAPYAAVSGPLGESNHLLQFTDALVVNKAQWEAVDEDRRNLIRAFINYFLEIDLRYKIAMGEDLDPQTNRYLLQAREGFYLLDDVASDDVYQDLYWSLQTAGAAPSLSDSERAIMQKVLSEKCIKLPAN